MGKLKLTDQELRALRGDIVQTSDLDVTAELIQAFLMNRGYGVSHAAAKTAAEKLFGEGMRSGEVITLKAIHQALEEIAFDA